MLKEVVENEGRKGVLILDNKLNIVAKNELFKIFFFEIFRIKFEFSHIADVQQVSLKVHDQMAELLHIVLIHEQKEVVNYGHLELSISKIKSGFVLEIKNNLIEHKFERFYDSLRYRYNKIVKLFREYEQKQAKLAYHNPVGYIQITQLYHHDEETGEEYFNGTKYFVNQEFMYFSGFTLWDVNHIPKFSRFFHEKDRKKIYKLIADYIHNRKFKPFERVRLITKDKNTEWVDVSVISAYRHKRFHKFVIELNINNVTQLKKENELLKGRFWDKFKIFGTTVLTISGIVGTVMYSRERMIVNAFVTNTREALRESERRRKEEIEDVYLWMYAKTEHKDLMQNNPVLRRIDYESFMKLQRNYDSLDYLFDAMTPSNTLYKIQSWEYFPLEILGNEISRDLYKKYGDKGIVIIASPRPFSEADSVKGKVN